MESLARAASGATPVPPPSDSGAAAPSEAVLRWLAVVVVAKIAAVTEAAADLLRWAGVAGEAFNDALPLVADLLPHDGVLLVHGSPSVLFDDDVEQLLHRRGGAHGLLVFVAGAFVAAGAAAGHRFLVFVLLSLLLLLRLTSEQKNK